MTTAVVEVSTATEKTPTYITGISSSSQDTINIYHTSIEWTTLPPATSSILSVVATPVASTATNPSTTTLAQLENTIIFAAAAPVLVILFITISIIIVVVIIWRRRNYKSTHNIAKHPVSTNDEVELQQNECYAKASFDDDNKQQQYVQYKRSMHNVCFLYRVDDDYAEVNQKQDDVILQQNEAYCTQVQLQQNVSYAATSASTNDKQQQYV